MKTMNYNNNIESEKNVNNVVANKKNAAFAVYENLTVNGVTRAYVVKEKVGERIGCMKIPGFANIGVAVNEPRGWRLDHTINFGLAHNAYIKSRMTLAKLVDMTIEQIGIDRDDKSLWAKDIRTLVADYIMRYDLYLENGDYFVDEKDYGDPNKLNESLTGIIFDGICIWGEIHDLANDIIPHTEEENKEYLLAEVVYLKRVYKRVKELEAAE